MLFIEGKPGTGKTTLLKFAIDNFKGRGKVIYINCKKMDKELDIEKVLLKKYGFFSRLLNKKPRDMILMLDEVQYLSKKNTEKIKYYYDQNYIKAVVFTSKNFTASKLAPSLKHRIGSRVITMGDLTEEDAIALIKSRIGNHPILNEEIVKEIYSKSNQNPKDLLQNCAGICKLAVEKGEQIVTLAILSEYFGQLVVPRPEILDVLDEVEEAIFDAEPEMDDEVLETPSFGEEPAVEILDESPAVADVEEISQPVEIHNESESAILEDSNLMAEEEFPEGIEVVDTEDAKTENKISVELKSTKIKVGDKEPEDISEQYY